MDQLTRQARVFARVEPRQKLDIVESLQRNGHFVAVSGDGANNAPALRAAQVGIAMGKSGTDVARETSDLVITDDNFASIVAGVEEGRIAYANVRKVIFLLISTGAAELVLFTLALLTAQPLPLLAVQLLWLNLVTNGIQDVALAFEPAEGDELRHSPRSPRESIFNRLMIERVVISALVIGTIAFFTFQWLLVDGCGLSDERDDAYCSPTDGAGERDAAESRSGTPVRYVPFCRQEVAHRPPPARLAPNLAKVMITYDSWVLASGNPQGRANRRIV